jgi:phosphoglycolate phosphatase
MNKPAMILIDLDGTLVDSVPDLAYCIDETMKRLGREPHGEDTVRQWVGNGVERLVMRALTGELWADPDPALFERAMPVFMDLYARNTSGRSRLYAGVREGLEYMRDQGYKLGCVTNKAEAFTVPLLKDMGIHDFFGIVVSGDTLPQKKPDPAPLLHAARQLGADAGHSLMVGDSEHDVKAARNAGFQVVCVTYGYNHGNDIRDAGPDAVIDSLAELKDLLERAA